MNTKISQKIASIWGTEAAKIGSFIMIPPMVINMMLKDLDLTFMEAWVVVCLAHHCRPPTYVAFPSLDTIANMIGSSRQSVYRAISSLEKKGVVIVTQGTWGKSNRYNLTPLREKLDGRGKDDPPKPELGPEDNVFMNAFDSTRSAMTFETAVADIEYELGGQISREDISLKIKEFQEFGLPSLEYIVSETVAYFEKICNERAIAAYASGEQ